jgi:hypothetical protein
LYALRRLGRRKTAVGLSPFVRFFSGTFFCAPKPLRGFFIGRKKMSHTTGTLCVIETRRYDTGGIHAAGKLEIIVKICSKNRGFKLDR